MPSMCGVEDQSPCTQALRLDTESQLTNKELIDLWKMSEQVAMHFNDQIQNFRLKALGAVTLGAGLIGTIVVPKPGTVSCGAYPVLSGAMVFLAVIWFAFFSIDFWYYQRLLRGAVNDAIRLERRSGNVIALSTQIEKDVVKKDRPKDEQTVSPGVGFWLFYALPFVALIGAAVFAYIGPPSNSPNQPTHQTIPQQIKSPP
jgi:hypothetical protein